MVRLLRADERANPNQTNEMGHTALMLGAIFGFTRVVKILLADDERVDTNLFDKKQGSGHSPSPLRKGSCRS